MTPPGQPDADEAIHDDECDPRRWEAFGWLLGRGGELRLRRRGRFGGSFSALRHAGYTRLLRLERVEFLLVRHTGLSGRDIQIESSAGKKQGDISGEGERFRTRELPPV